MRPVVRLLKTFSQILLHSSSLRSFEFHAMNPSLTPKDRSFQDGHDHGARSNQAYHDAAAVEEVCSNLKGPGIEMDGLGAPL